MTETNSDIEILQRLYAVIESRKDSDADSSYTASLLQAGMPKIAQKLGEEAVETVIEAIAKRKGHLIEESADVLYFLLVMWKDRGIAPKDVWKELAKRHKMPEIEERAGRLK